MWTWDWRTGSLNCIHALFMVVMSGNTAVGELFKCQFNHLIFDLMQVTESVHYKTENFTSCCIKLRWNKRLGRVLKGAWQHSMNVCSCFTSRSTCFYVLLAISISVVFLCIKHFPISLSGHLKKSLRFISNEMNHEEDCSKIQYILESQREQTKNNMY